MPKYKITDTSLNNIATAIKNKVHTTESLVYPTGFVNTLNNIESGYETYGFIDITYPAGSDCVAISSDGVEFNAPDTSGKWILKVPEPATLETTWTISCSDGENSDSKEVVISNEIRKQEVKLINPPRVLNNATWEQISEVAQAGQGDQYWDIGDCKEIILNGVIGAGLALDNVTLCVFILDFNHPIDRSTTDNNIIFGGFKTALTDGIDVCLCDSQYPTSYYNVTKYFNINHYGSSSGNYNTNYGGWKGCDFRYDILGTTSTQPSKYGSTYKTTANVGYDAIEDTITTPIANTLMAALPSDFRSILRLWDRYVDFKGNSSNTDANCSTATIDAGISLLAEFEIFGSRAYANTYEQNHQKQMQYYIDGNSPVKYKHNATSTAANWWESSAHYNSEGGFCVVQTSGSSNGCASIYSRGLAPAFKV